MDNLEILQSTEEQYVKDNDDLIQLRLHDEFLHVATERSVQLISMGLNSVCLDIALRAPYNAVQFQLLPIRRCVIYGSDRTITMYNTYQPYSAPEKFELRVPLVQFKMSRCEDILAVVYAPLLLSVSSFSDGNVKADGMIFWISLLDDQKLSVDSVAAAASGWTGDDVLGHAHGVRATVDDSLLVACEEPHMDNGRVSMTWTQHPNGAPLLAINFRPSGSCNGRPRRRRFAVFDCTNAEARLLWYYGGGDKAAPAPAASAAKKRGRPDAAEPRALSRPTLGQALAWRHGTSQLALPFQAGVKDYVGIWDRGDLVTAMELFLRFPVRALNFSSNGRALFVWQHDAAALMDHVAIYVYTHGTWTAKLQLHHANLVAVLWEAGARAPYGRGVYAVRLVNDQNAHLVYVVGRVRARNVVADEEAVGRIVAVVEGNRLRIADYKDAVAPIAASGVTITLPPPHVGFNLVRLHRAQPIVAIVTDRLQYLLYDYKTGDSVCGACAHVYATADTRPGAVPPPLFPLNALSAYFPRADSLLFRMCELASGDVMDVAVPESCPTCQNYVCREEPISDKPPIVFGVDINDEREYADKADRPQLQREAIKIDGVMYKFRVDYAGCFMINTVAFQEEVTSFYLDSQNLIVSTYDYLFYIDVTADNLQKLMTLANLKTIYRIAIDVGATIVHYLPNRQSALMFTPRGNLELVCLPVNFMNKLRVCVETMDFKTSCQLIRLEKLPLNVLVDFDIYSFVSAGAAEFIEQVDTDCVVQLITELNDTNLIRTDQSPAKRKLVCDAIRRAFMVVHEDHIDADGAAVLVLTSLFGTAPPDQTAALLELKALLSVERSRSDGAGNVELIGRNVLKRLRQALPKVDWFQAALRTYDLDFAEFVAMHSRADPQQYNQLLGRLRAQPALLRFRVLDHLGEYALALGHLINYATSAREGQRVQMTIDAVNWIVAKKLSRRALTQIRHRCGGWPRICQLEQALAPIVAGELLLRASEHAHNAPDAAAIYLRTGQPVAAFQALLRANASVAPLLGAVRRMSALELEQLPRGWQMRLCEQLAQSGRGGEVMLMWQMFGLDVEMLVVTLVDCGLFWDALAMTVEADRKDLCETIIVEAVKMRCLSLLADINADYAAFTEMRTRLGVVRLKRAEDMLHRATSMAAGAGGEGGAGGAGDAGGDSQQIYDDTESQMSRSTVSRASAQTGTQSQRRRRREARKRDRIRPGSNLEDVNLIRELYGKVERVFRLTTVVKDIYWLQISYLRPAKMNMERLAGVIIEVQSDMLKHIKEIWPSELNALVNPSPSEALPGINSINQNICHLELKYRTPPDNIKDVFTDI